jgi:radial spoke head protein 9
MKATELGSQLRYLSPAGTTLSLEERMQLELSLLSLYERESFEQVFLWGRVTGVLKDYYIALTLNFQGHREFPLKRYFWTNSQIWHFAELPQVTAAEVRLAEQFNSYFSGEHDKILVQVSEPELPQVARDEDEEDEEQGTVESRTKNFTELERLAVVVRNIEADCQVVPEGAYVITPAQELGTNSQYKGLSRLELRDLGKFYHFRPVRTLEKRELLDRGTTPSTTDFLDPIDKDMPKGCWKLQLDASKTQVAIRSLYWPGYIAYAVADSLTFGGFYSGDGVKNKDLPFML